ncbi:MAG TPA: succinyldiaminopimelate transaminase [Nocardioidaceae bacterium]|nr:succinyldiaminopimelate transaminase [Nocardioidaceae bacterium]
MSSRLPDFPWDALIPYGERARAHPGGIVDLSIGTPVDPTPDLVQRALQDAANAPGYPKAVGTTELRDAASGWLRRRFDAIELGRDCVIPTVGSKELVASLASHLGLGAGDTVVVPELAYPTYDVGARLAGCDVVAADGTLSLGPRPVALLWLNSPANPTGRVLPAEHLRKVVRWARERGVLVVSDECYLECGWEAEPVSVLHPDVCEGSAEGLLTVHSLSKRSNLAGYRGGFVAGDSAVVAELLEVRRHAGLLVPWPVQQAMRVALDDDAHVDEQRQRYAARRTALRAALESAGFRIDHSQAALYLWASRDEPCWESIGWLAERGILAAPGDFYGRAGAQHVRVAFTATDERVAAAVDRLTG